jgi:hypothetical protein
MGAPWLQSEKTWVKVENNKTYVTLEREDPYFVETCILITGLFQCNSCLKFVGNSNHGLLSFPTFKQPTTKNAQCLIFYFVNYLNHHKDTNIVFLEAFKERLQTKQTTLAQMDSQTSGQRKLQTALYTISARIQISSATIAYRICNCPHFYIPSDVKPVYFREFTKYIQANRGELHSTATNDVWTNYSSGSNQLIDYIVRGPQLTHLSPIEYFSQITKVYKPKNVNAPFSDTHPQYFSHGQVIETDRQHYAVALLDPYLPEYDTFLSETPSQEFFTPWTSVEHLPPSCQPQISLSKKG